MEFSELHALESLEEKLKRLGAELTNAIETNDLYAAHYILEYVSRECLGIGSLMDQLPENVKYLELEEAEGGYVPLAMLHLLCMYEAYDLTDVERLQQLDTYGLNKIFPAPNFLKLLRLYNTIPNLAPNCCKPFWKNLLVKAKTRTGTRTLLSITIAENFARINSDLNQLLAPHTHTHYNIFDETTAKGKTLFEYAYSPDMLVVLFKHASDAMAKKMHQKLRKKSDYKAYKNNLANFRKLLVGTTKLISSPHVKLSPKRLAAQLESTLRFVTFNDISEIARFNLIDAILLSPYTKFYGRTLAKLVGDFQLKPQKLITYILDRPKIFQKLVRDIPGFISLHNSMGSHLFSSDLEKVVSAAHELNATEFLDALESIPAYEDIVKESRRPLAERITDLASKNINDYTHQDLKAIYDYLFSEAGTRTALSVIKITVPELLKQTYRLSSFEFFKDIARKPRFADHSELISHYEFFIAIEEGDLEIVEARLAEGFTSDLKLPGTQITALEVAAGGKGVIQARENCIDLFGKEIDKVQDPYYRHINIFDRLLKVAPEPAFRQWDMQACKQYFDLSLKSFDLLHYQLSTFCMLAKLIKLKALDSKSKEALGGLSDNLSFQTLRLPFSMQSRTVQSIFKPNVQTPEEYKGQAESPEEQRKRQERSRQEYRRQIQNIPSIIALLSTMTTIKGKDNKFLRNLINSALSTEYSQTKLLRYMGKALKHYSPPEEALSDELRALLKKITNAAKEYSAKKFLKSNIHQDLITYVNEISGQHLSVLYRKTEILEKSGQKIDAAWFHEKLQELEDKLQRGILLKSQTSWGTLAELFDTAVCQLEILKKAKDEIDELFAPKLLKKLITETKLSTEKKAQLKAEEASRAERVSTPVDLSFMLDIKDGTLSDKLDVLQGRFRTDIRHYSKNKNFRKLAMSHFTRLKSKCMALEEAQDIKSALKACDSFESNMSKNISHSYLATLRQEYDDERLQALEQLEQEKDKASIQRLTGFQLQLLEKQESHTAKIKLLKAAIKELKSEKTRLLEAQQAIQGQLQKYAKLEKRYVRKLAQEKEGLNSANKESLDTLATQQRTELESIEDVLEKISHIKQATKIIKETAESLRRDQVNAKKEKIFSELKEKYRVAFQKSKSVLTKPDHLEQLNNLKSKHSAEWNNNLSVEERICAIEELQKELSTLAQTLLNKERAEQLAIERTQEKLSDKLKEIKQFIEALSADPEKKEALRGKFNALKHDATQMEPTAGYDFAETKFQQLKNKLSSQERFDALSTSYHELTIEYQSSTELSRESKAVLKTLESRHKAKLSQVAKQPQRLELITQCTSELKARKQELLLSQEHQAVKKQYYDVVASIHRSEEFTAESKAEINGLIEEQGKRLKAVTELSDRVELFKELIIQLNSTQGLLLSQQRQIQEQQEQVLEQLQRETTSISEGLNAPETKTSLSCSENLDVFLLMQEHKFKLARARTTSEKVECLQTIQEQLNPYVAKVNAAKEPAQIITPLTPVVETEVLSQVLNIVQEPKIPTISETTVTTTAVQQNKPKVAEVSSQSSIFVTKKAPTATNISLDWTALEFIKDSSTNGDLIPNPALWEQEDRFDRLIQKAKLIQNPSVAQQAYVRLSEIKMIFPDIANISFQMDEFEKQVEAHLREQLSTQEYYKATIRETRRCIESIKDSRSREKYKKQIRAILSVFDNAGYETLSIQKHYVIINALKDIQHMINLRQQYKTTLADFKNIIAQCGDNNEVRDLKQQAMLLGNKLIELDSTNTLTSQSVEKSLRELRQHCEVAKYIQRMKHAMSDYDELFYDLETAIKELRDNTKQEAYFSELDTLDKKIDHAYKNRTLQMNELQEAMEDMEKLYDRLDIRLDDQRHIELARPYEMMRARFIARLDVIENTITKEKFRRKLQHWDKVVDRTNRTSVIERACLKMKEYDAKLRYFEFSDMLLTAIKDMPGLPRKDFLKRKVKLQRGAIGKVSKVANIEAQIEKVINLFKIVVSDTMNKLMVEYNASAANLNGDIKKVTHKATRIEFLNRVNKVHSELTNHSTRTEIRAAIKNLDFVNNDLRNVLISSDQAISLQKKFKGVIEALSDDLSIETKIWIKNSQKILSNSGPLAANYVASMEEDLDCKLKELIADSKPTSFMGRLMSKALSIFKTPKHMKYTVFHERLFVKNNKTPLENSSSAKILCTVPEARQASSLELDVEGIVKTLITKKSSRLDDVHPVLRESQNLEQLSRIRNPACAA